MVAQPSGQVLPFRVERARKPTWRTWVRKVQGPAERRQFVAVRGYLRAEKARIIARFESDPVIAALGVARSIVRRDLIDDIVARLFAGEDAAFGEVIDPGIRASVKEGTEWIASLLPRATYDPSLDPSDQIIGEEIVRVNREAKAFVAEVVRTGLREGQTIGEMTATIQLDSGGLFGPARALRIARTESTKAVNEGHGIGYQTAVAAGVDFDLEWSSAIDRATRPSHVAMDGQTIPPGGRFTITTGPNAGDTGRFPGDFDKAAEVVNCRCCTVPNVRD